MFYINKQCLATDLHRRRITQEHAFNIRDEAHISNSKQLLTWTNRINLTTNEKEC